MSVNFKWPVLNSWKTTFLTWSKALGVLTTFLTTVVSKEMLEFKTWSPVYTCSGAMTFTPDSGKELAVYLKVFGLVLFMVAVSGTTGGVGDIAVIFTLPVSIRDTFSWGSVPFVASVSSDGGLTVGGTGLYNSTTTGRVRRYDNAAWTVGASRTVWALGIYRAGE